MKDYLNGRARGTKIRKWFYTSDEILDAKILKDDNLLGKNIKIGMKLLETAKYKIELKAEMRVIASKSVFIMDDLIKKNIKANSRIETNITS